MDEIIVLPYEIDLLDRSKMCATINHNKHRQKQ